MKLTISLDDNIFALDVTNDLELENLIAYCEAESGLPFNNLVLIHNGRPLTEAKKTLQEYNIVDNDMIYVMPKTGGSQQSRLASQAPTSDSASNQRLSGVTEISVAQARQIRDSFLANPDQLIAMKQNNPQLNDALESNNIDVFCRVLNEQYKRRKDEEARRARMMNADPFDPEAQRMIAEEIKQQQIDTNMHHAMEFLPESFGQVHMLYIKCKVNGFDIDAFVDSGAQSTIMSKACADMCNITRLIDDRWSGIAQGVGTQKILGRIHICDIQIENNYLPCSFSVLEQQPMDMLLGLDMLKRHQCVIDLKENILKIGTTGSETKFLAESEIQKSRASSSSNPSASSSQK